MEKKTSNLRRLLSLAGSTLRTVHVSIVAIVVVLMVLSPAVAWGQEVAPTALSRFASGVLDLLIPIFVAFIGSLVTWILYKIKEKFHISVSQDTQDQWADLAEKAALRGAEYARSKAKDLTEGKKVPGPEVLEVAAQWAIGMAENLKLPALASDKLKGLIEAHLFKLRIMDETNKANTVVAAAGTPGAVLAADMTNLSKI